MNNPWNATSKQCLEICSGTAWKVTQANHNLPLAGPPASYPAIFKGCHWGNCTQGSSLPIQVSRLASAISNWSTVQPSSGAYNVSYDIWFNPNSTTPDNFGGTELMIWISKFGGPLPAGGSSQATITVNNMKWEVWSTRMDKWNYVAYMLAGSNARSVIDLDIKAITEDAVNRGFIKPSWYLIGVEAGFEIWQGGAGLGTNSFSFEAK
jgi:cellulose 1,4-beta-cellobiosidase